MTDDEDRDARIERTKQGDRMVRKLAIAAVTDYRNGDMQTGPAYRMLLEHVDQLNRRQISNLVMFAIDYALDYDDEDLRDEAVRNEYLAEFGDFGPFATNDEERDDEDDDDA